MKFFHHTYCLPMPFCFCAEVVVCDVMNGLTITLFSWRVPQPQRKGTKLRWSRSVHQELAQQIPACATHHLAIKQSISSVIKFCKQLCCQKNASSFPVCNDQSRTLRRDTDSSESCKFGCWVKLVHLVHKRYRSLSNSLSINFSPWGTVPCCQLVTLFA